MRITKLGLKGHAPTKGSGTTMAEAVTWAESGGKVVVPFDSNNWSYQNPQWLSFVLNAGTTYTITFPDESWWLMEGGVAQVKDAGGNTVASITASYNEESWGIVTTPATVIPSGTGTYYLYVEYGGYGEGDATIRVSVTPEPGSPPSTHFLPWESGFTKKGDAVKTYENVQSAAISPLMKGSRFASNYFMDSEFYGRKVIVILDNKLYWVYNGQCKLIDDSRKYIGMLATYYDALVFDAEGNMWAVGWTGENEDTRLWSGVVLAMDGTVKFPDFYTYAYSGADLNRYVLPVLVNNKLALISRANSVLPFMMKVFEDWPSMRMFSYEKQWAQDGVVCWNLAVGLDNKLYKYTMTNNSDSKCELLDGGRWKIASGAIFYHYNEQGWAVGIKDDGKLYGIYDYYNYENPGDTVQIRLIDETHTWRWCISSKTPLAITTDGELYFLGWRGMDYDPHFELANLSTGNCSKAVPCSWSAGNHRAYAIIDGGLYKVVNDNETMKVVRIGTASDWTDVIGGGFYVSDNKEKSYGYAVRDNKMYAIKDDSVWELPSFTEYTGGSEYSSSSGAADDSSSSSGSTPSSSPSEIIVTATGLTPICTDKTLTIVDPNATGTSRIWRNQYYDEGMYEYHKTEVRYDSYNSRWEIYDGQTMGGGENDWMPMGGNPIYSETTSSDPWTSGLNWYYVDVEVEHDATVTITPAGDYYGGSSSSSGGSQGDPSIHLSFDGAVGQIDDGEQIYSYLPNGYSWELSEDAGMADNYRNMSLSATFIQHPSMTTTVGGNTYHVWYAPDGWDAVLMSKSYAEQPDIMHNGSVLPAGSTIHYDNVPYLFATEDQDDPLVRGWIVGNSNMVGDILENTLPQMGIILQGDYEEEISPDIPDLSTAVSGDWTCEGTGPYPAEWNSDIINITYVYSAGGGGSSSSSGAGEGGGGTGTVTFTNSGSESGSITLNGVTQSIAMYGTVTFSDVPAGTYTPTYSGPSIAEGDNSVIVAAGETTAASCFFQCFVEGTLIRLADGTDKAVEDITYDDELLVWDFDNGCFASAKPAWIKVEETAPEYLLSKYDNGAELRTVGPIGMHHEVFDANRQLFDYTDRMLGRQVMTLDGTARCTDCSIIRQEVKFYNIITERHFNLYANGILTSCRLNKLYDIKDMKFVKERSVGGVGASYDDFDQKLVEGLRLDEQPADMHAYVNRFMKLAKPR